MTCLCDCVVAMSAALKRRDKPPKRRRKKKKTLSDSESEEDEKGEISKAPPSKRRKENPKKPKKLPSLWSRKQPVALLTQTILCPICIVDLEIFFYKCSDPCPLALRLPVVFYEEMYPSIYKKNAPFVNSHQNSNDCSHVGLSF